MYQRRNITAYGMSFLRQFIDKYYINCMPKEKDKLDKRFIKSDIKKFINLLNSIPDKYIYKQNYEILIKEYNKIKKEKEKGFQDYYRQVKEENDRQTEYLVSNFKLELESKYKLKIKDLEKELKNQKTINEKWKTMFTEQAMANAKLINNDKKN